MMQMAECGMESNIGITPNTSGNLIRLPLPPLTEERRIDLVKQTKVEIEKAKVSSRNIRQKTNDEIKKLGKEGVSEDLVRDAEEQVQELTNQFTKSLKAL